MAQAFHTGTQTRVLASSLIEGAAVAVFEATLATGNTQIVTTGTLTQDPQDLAKAWAAAGRRR